MGRPPAHLYRPGATPDGAAAPCPVTADALAAEARRRFEQVLAFWRQREYPFAKFGSCSFALRAALGRLPARLYLAARHVAGERLGRAGMPWPQGKAEALLQLRRIELNGDWERFRAWVQGRNRHRLGKRQRLRILTDQLMRLPKVARAVYKRHLHPNEMRSAFPAPCPYQGTAPPRGPSSYAPGRSWA